MHCTVGGGNGQEVRWSKGERDGIMRFWKKCELFEIMNYLKNVMGFELKKFFIFLAFSAVINFRIKSRGIHLSGGRIAQIGLN